ncbi:MAG: tetratricopeptide repeat protein, partial [Bacteroidota bacterium]|nr:tetratricopeptide repeat protein [Bacteroidota bacterium]MDX5505241.1 tetratricopeptide repeat protein [Bacteroidota bacterium]
MDKRNKLIGWIISAVLLLPIIASAQKYRSNWEKGNKAYEEGDYPLAQKHYSEALADRPEAAEQYFNLGDALFKQDKPKEAIEAYRKSLEAFSDPADQAKALHNIGNAHMKLKQFQQAVEAYKDALRR